MQAVQIIRGKSGAGVSSPSPVGGGREESGKNGVSSTRQPGCVGAQRSKMEDFLLDAFTKYCEDNGTEDLLLKYLKPFFKQYLRISDKLIYFLQPHDFILKGTTEVVDFERYLYRGGLFLILNQNLDLIQDNWKLVLNSLGRKPSYKERLTFSDVQKLAASLNQDTPQSTVADMLTLQGDKQYIDFFDFALILGRVGELNMKWD
ncbi:hypothetical protein KL921_002316 [Ogataea angusta]|nr:hypothetical protein KL921_002316 [Ogataea angusta]KAG7841292.1 hypothetical protein KL941_005389 [Ogataea angusta]